ncbi:hypothetical protein T4E_11145 [Trichinella pseudospiralis]|uniref:Protein quiver n=1 Tax=Trichinella pseudospiralis TaxID=6337 RepID=A0A0V0YFX2_TRIPS|nr:hypothetical protein T4E_11145 [Trichinella pseudospiralis]
MPVFYLKKIMEKAMPLQMQRTLTSDSNRQATLVMVIVVYSVMIIKYGCSGSLFLPNRLLLSLYFAFITSCAAYLEHRCYSCMSLAFKEKWYFLSDTYYAPLNFTDDCDEPMKNGKIGTVSCNSACMMISEASYVGGQFTGFNYIRGCIHKIARKGFNNVTIYKMGLERRNICHRVSRSQLFRSHSYMEDQVTACICYGNECNGAKAIRNSCSKKMLHYSVYFVASIILFIILYESIKI